MSEPRPTPAPSAEQLSALRAARPSRCVRTPQSSCWSQGEPPYMWCTACTFLALDAALLALETQADAALALPPPAAPHGYVPTREEAIADITYVRNMLQWHQEKSVQWVPEIEKLNYALEHLAAALPASAPTAPVLQWFAERDHPDKPGFRQARGFATQAEAQLCVDAWGTGIIWVRPPAAAPVAPALPEIQVGDIVTLLANDDDGGDLGERIYMLSDRVVDAARSRPDIYELHRLIWTRGPRSRRRSSPTWD